MTTLKLKLYKGRVVSDKMDKTRVVAMERFIKHPLYGKRLKVRKKYHVHDTKNDSKINDLIEFKECRPLSKTKRWKMTKIISKAKVLGKVSEAEE